VNKSLKRKFVCSSAAVVAHALFLIKLLQFFQLKKERIASHQPS
jgi:hypothetical protein